MGLAHSRLRSPSLSPIGTIPPPSYLRLYPPHYSRHINHDPKYITDGHPPTEA